MFSERMNDGFIAAMWPCSFSASSNPRAHDQISTRPPLNLLMWKSSGTIFLLWGWQGAKVTGTADKRKARVRSLELAQWDSDAKHRSGMKTGPQALTSSPAWLCSLTPSPHQHTQSPAQSLGAPAASKTTVQTFTEDELSQADSQLARRKEGTGDFSAEEPLRKAKL